MRFPTPSSPHPRWAGSGLSDTIPAIMRKAIMPKAGSSPVPEVKMMRRRSVARDNVICIPYVSPSSPLQWVWVEITNPANLKLFRAFAVFSGAVLVFRCL